jgi:citrate synthase
VHAQCAVAWGVDEPGAQLIRMALVLCADHELNASGFTARCVASTGASVRASLIGGLAALTGGKHGAATARVEALWNEIDTALQTEGTEPARQVVRLWQARDGHVPGFGHHLYPGGDPRAQLLLVRMLPSHPAWVPLIEMIQAVSGQPPSIDFALVALRRHLGLPLGAAFGLFALGRSVGWIAHALEQRANENLIRPRAAYVGPRPGPVLSSGVSGVTTGLSGLPLSATPANSAEVRDGSPDTGADARSGPRPGPFSDLFSDKP